MSNVEFEDNDFPGGRPVSESSGTPTLVRILLKFGVVKDEKQANYVLIGIAVCAVILTLFVIKGSFGGRPNPNQNAVPFGAGIQGGAIPPGAAPRI